MCSIAILTKFFFKTPTISGTDDRRVIERSEDQDEQCKRAISRLTRLKLTRYGGVRGVEVVPTLAKE